MNKNLENEVYKTEIELNLKQKKLTNIKEKIIYSLLNLVENRDTDTGSHVKRTSILIKLLAQQSINDGIYTDILNENYINLLEKVAPMHDLGKIVVPDYILKKNGSLTEKEFEKIKLHPEAGGKIIMSLIGTEENDEYVKLAFDIATKHHEKWNGKGYPYNMSKENIPLCARLMAIVDVFDALVSTRCYKKALSLEEALVIIQEGSGSHFDPMLVPEFLKLKPQLKQIINKYGEI